MSAWMSIVEVTAAEAVLQLTGAVAYSWREQARARSNRQQIEAAAGADALVLDRRGKQPETLIVPLGSRHDA